ncbi:class I mannose-6-phosphate isomerase [uncultured Lacticaseibacillus sp.]|uniref:class I mannose-6-phosphate isomerase n=1 Tax=uncultured Lacticaseibacillus sp. TaxID=2775882 RepID=UPI002593B786|nr:class I mannose-6-phosphate isomerase [uncultured Lacticaseibacillus sp.]
MKYDLRPETKVASQAVGFQGAANIVNTLRNRIAKVNTNDVTVVMEFYPGVERHEIEDSIIDRLGADNTVFADDYALTAEQVNAKIADSITDDRVLGRMTQYRMDEFFPDLAGSRAKVAAKHGVTVVYGTGASLLAPSPDVLVYFDLTRWEIQLRYRAGLSNWRQDNADDDALRKFKRGYFFEWRIADRLKKELLPHVDYLIDSNVANEPKMIDGSSFLAGLEQLTAQPYRTVPYFDESVWGGQWMKKHFGLPDNVPNYGWAFDGVPEENSIILRYGDVPIEVPATDLLLNDPEPILGAKVYARFGAEFPIRFDYLDTVGGGNLSLQVHPLTQYIKDRYGMNYTQDESYYILHAEEGASVYLGNKPNVDKAALAEVLRAAERGDEQFPDDKYINKFPAKTGDHFLIPAGTVHCGGGNTVILEISATPYIFTFKMWDWGRIGLDGKPRPLHVEEGLDNIRLERDTQWVQDNLINQFVPVGKNQYERVDKTGLASDTEFIETRRHEINTVAHLSNHHSVNMLNMVDGREAKVISQDGSFSDFTVHFGETFIVPASVNEYEIRNVYPDQPIKVIQAFVK